MDALPIELNHMAIPDSVPDSMLSYVNWWMQTFCASDKQPEVATVFSRSINELARTDTASLEASADRGVPEDRLKLALRSVRFTAIQHSLLTPHSLISGCGVEKDTTKAYALLLMNVGSPTHVPRPVAARAFSMMAGIEKDIAFKNAPAQCNISALLRAAQYANSAAELGFVSPVVLYLAKRVTDIGARSPSTWKYAHPYEPGFATLDHMWEAYDDRTKEVTREARLHDRKVAKDPAAYRCASPGCGITATRKAALSQCGRCPPGNKAHYCSKECQNAVRDAPHSQLCRTGKGTRRTASLEKVMSQSTRRRNLGPLFPSAAVLMPRDFSARSATVGSAQWSCRCLECWVAKFSSHQGR